MRYPLNGVGICEVAVVTLCQPSSVQKFTNSTPVEPLTSSRHSANTNLAVRAFIHRLLSLVLL